MSDMVAAFLNEVKDQTRRDLRALGDDLVMDVLGIANTASELLLQSARGVDVTRDMCHLQAQFQTIMSIKAYRSQEEARAIFLRALAATGELAQKTIASALAAFLERQSHG